MKTAICTVAFAFVVALFGAAQAADKGAKKEKAAGGEVTLSGEMSCGKCSLKETEKCQNVLKVGEDKYYLAQNDTAKGAHKKICQAPAKATVKGTVAEDGGKKTLTASEIKYE